MSGADKLGSKGFSLRDLLPSQIKAPTTPIGTLRLKTKSAAAAVIVAAEILPLLAAHGLPVSQGVQRGVMAAVEILKALAEADEQAGES